MINLEQNKHFILLISVIFLISISGCDKNTTEPEKESPPDLPPVASMETDLSFFSQGKELNLAKSNMSKLNFANAAIRVTIINGVVILASVVPAGVLAAALSDENPELKSDGKFHWIYNYPETNPTFSVDFAGWVDIRNAEIVWEIYVSSTKHSPGLNNFLWYNGRSKIGNAEGWWMFHDDQSPDSLIDVLKIDWKITDETHKELVFSNVWDTNTNYGDSLKYKIDDVNDYLIYYDASQSLTNTIYWNSQTGAGYIEWFDYNDGLPGYWDENQDDTNTPPS